ncbi:MAG TPA: flagellar basal body P-ring protein FlgI [Candidatus Hydrogenedentes bacterium]|nr:flagellar basal body P-ring protein FlgI [Candidatus Hydrogenedentota bacterium]HOS02958.1 flagellar basal body P-ring protein FlgI [Candidatus Hydrogenedentota bacterium]
MISMRWRTWMAVAALAILGAQTAQAMRLKDLCDIQGARGNALTGIGLVIGLAGTGDKTPAAINAQQRMLDRLNIDIASTKELKSDNVAVVIVTATFPAFAKEGTRIDVQVSSIYDCKSLEGGTLLETLMCGIDNETYAVAQGPISIGGFNASGGGGAASVRKNHVTAGRVPMGAYIEREIPSTITDGQRISLLLKQPDFTTANNIQEALNQTFGATAATALGAGVVQIDIPNDAKANLVSFIARLQDLDVKTGTPSRVVINERTGTIVVGENVMVKPCQIAHGSLSIRISTVTEISQPAPLSYGTTEKAKGTSVDVTEQSASLLPVEGTSAAEVANALNKLKVTPRDLIAIFQALRQAGSLEADLEIM